MATKIDEKLVEKLKRTGLTPSESKVYATVLASHGAYPSTIADTTGINRSSVYKTLTTLEIRGLVSVIEKGKKLYYQA
jgi:sugar-specific transcriptional regulator TrmB